MVNATWFDANSAAQLEMPSHCTVRSGALCSLHPLQFAPVASASASVPLLQLQLQRSDIGPSPPAPAKLRVCIGPSRCPPQKHSASIRYAQPWLWVKMKTDGINPVPSASVYRIFSSIFIFCGINRNRTENGTGYIGTGTENGWAFFRPYCRYPVFYRDIPVFIPFIRSPGQAQRALSRAVPWAGGQPDLLLQSALFGCMQNITLFVTRTCICI
jgi:hypothetical protein